MVISTPRDADFVPVLSGEGDDSLTHAWSIDSITGRVKMDITIVPSYVPSAPIQRALKDANYRNTITGIADDSSGHVLAAAANSSNGLLAVDLVME